MIARVEVDAKTARMCRLASELLEAIDRFNKARSQRVAASIVSDREIAAMPVQTGFSPRRRFWYNNFHKGREEEHGIDRKAKRPYYIS